MIDICIHKLSFFFNYLLLEDFFNNVAIMLEISKFLLFCILLIYKYLNISFNNFPCFVNFLGYLFNFEEFFFSFQKGEQIECVPFNSTVLKCEIGNPMNAGEVIFSFPLFFFLII